MHGCLVLTWLFATSSACGADTPAEMLVDPGDGSTSDATDDATSVAEVAPPMAVNLPAPILVTCPEGWTAVVEDDVAVACSPFPADRPACEGAEAQFPGDSACAPIGPTCPTEFAEDLPASGVVYVKAGAQDGDGTRETPFATIGAALASLGGATTIALAPGTYDGAFVLPARVTLAGACTESTVLASTSASNDAAVISAMGEGAVVERLRVSESARPAVLLASAELTLRDVLIETATGAAIRVTDGAHLVVENVAIRDIRPLDDGSAGQGILATESVIDATRLSIERARSSALAVVGASARCTVTDLAIRDSAPRDSDGGGGIGIFVDGGAQLTVTRAAIDRNVVVGLLIQNGPSELTISDVVVRQTRPIPSTGEWGQGIAIFDGAALDLRRGLLEKLHDGAIYGASDATIRLRDVVVRDLIANEGPFTSSAGVLVNEASELDVERTLISRAAWAGIFAHQDCTVNARDVFVRDTQPDDNGFATGLVMELGGRVDVERALLERNGQGVDVRGADGALTDLTLLDTHGWPRVFGQGSTRLAIRSPVRLRRAPTRLVETPDGTGWGTDG